MKKLVRGIVSQIELLYACNADFQKQVNQLRDQLEIKIGHSGLVSIEDILAFDSKVISSRTFGEEYSSKIGDLAEKYNLTDYLTDLIIFVESGSIFYSEKAFINERLLYRGRIRRPTFKKREYPGYSSKTQLPNTGIVVSFMVRRPIDKNDLKYWLEDNLEEILVTVNDHFKGIRKSAIKVRNARRVLRIIELKDKHKYTFAQIADTITNENPEDPDVVEGRVNEVSVRQTYNRYKKKKFA